MTISNQHQTDNIDDALRAILEIIGDDEHLDVLFQREDLRLRNVMETTWEHLEATGSLNPLGMWLRLTPSGWVGALRAARSLDNPKMKEKLGKLCAAMKRRCEEGGVRHLASTTIQQLSEETGFSEAWIFNVVDSHLIRVSFQQVDCEWEPDDDNKNHIVIPARFGLKL
jgi:hypothetical protein